MKQHVNTKKDFSWITPALARSARAYLGLKLSDIQKECGVSLDVISRFERGATNARHLLRERLFNIYYSAGVEMTPEGIRIKKPK